MAPVNTILSCVQSLEENPIEVYLEVTGVLLTLATNVIDDPSNPKFRSVRLANPTIANKLVPAIGAMECLFEMGFEEADDSLVLSETTSLHNLKLTRDEILRRRKIILSNDSVAQSGAASAKSSDSVTQSKVTTAKPAVKSADSANQSKVASAKPAGSAKSASPSSQDFVVKSEDFIVSQPIPGVTPHTVYVQRLSATLHVINIIRTYSKYVLHYESESLQREALACIPLAELEFRAEQRLRVAQRAIKKFESPEKIAEPTAEEMLLLELMSWFKNSFFRWVDSPPCSNCSKETKPIRTDRSQGFNIDVYWCAICNKETLFPRYNDARKLLETRRGRCGEWANCFTLLCRSLKYEARLVIDATDHVWTEVFLPSYGRWVHCDPCEDAFDQPLMYEVGWNKKLSYILAFSADDIQDVSWRYSACHSELMKRRGDLTESALLDRIIKKREQLQQNISPARKAYLEKRTLNELVDLMKEPVADRGNYSGRQSGSLAWRLARGEIEEAKFSDPYVWKPNKTEIEKQLMHIQYSTSTDCYTRPAGGNEIVRGWRNGAYLVESVFKKEEKDWKMVYLARTEGSEEGLIDWKFDFKQTGLVVDTITIVLNKFTCDEGSVFVQMCGDESCLLLGGSELTTNALSGEETISLKVILSGGDGAVAWQHAQILRSSCDSQDVTLDIKIKLKPRSHN